MEGIHPSSNDTCTYTGLQAILGKVYNCVIVYVAPTCSSQTSNNYVMAVSDVTELNHEAAEGGVI